MRLSGTPDLANAVTITNDRTLVILGGNRVPIQVLDGRTGVPAWKNPATAGDPVLTVQISPDGTKLTGITSRGLVREWTLTSGDEGNSRENKTVPGANPVRTSANLKRAVVMDPQTWTAVVLDLQTGAQISRTGRHVYASSPPVISPDGTRVLTMAAYDRTIRVWDADTGKELFDLPGHVAEMNGAAFSPDGRRIVTCGNDGWVKLWNAKSGREALTFRGLGAVTAVGFSPDGSKLIAANASGQVHVFDAGLEPGK
jgi:WD40 repeat protein